MTGLTALNSFFLPLLPLAALPVIFHLFFRLKTTPRVFSTLMFFQRIDPKFNARRRLREWLILALRTLLILFLLLALAHPVWFGVGRQGPVAVALVIDNSGSMSGFGTDGRTKLKQAAAAARELVAQLRDQDSAGIVLLVNDPLVPVPLGLTSDKLALRNALDQLTETEAGGSVAAALERAGALFEKSTASHFEIQVFSDLQSDKWNQPPVNLRAPRTGTSLVVHRLPSPELARVNVAITGVRLSTRVVLSGRKLPVEVQLANSLASEGRVRLNWTTDSGTQGGDEVSVAPNSEKTVTVTLEPPAAGQHWAGFELAGDDFNADNHAFIGFNAQEKQTVNFLGQPADYGLLPLALSPTADGKLSGLLTTFNATPDFSGGFLALTWDAFAANTPALGDGLKQFLEAGGCALIVPPAGAAAGFNPLPDWIAAVPEDFASASNGVALIALDKANPLFNDLRDEKGDVALHNVKAFRYLPLRTATNTTPVLGLENGSALLAEQRVGRGRLFVSGLAFDSGWSTLVLKPAFIAFAQNLALAQTGDGRDATPLVAGEPLRLATPADKNIEVQSLGGSPLDWNGLAAQLPTLPRAGVYVIRSAGGTNRVAVRSSEKEGRQNFVTGDRLPALGTLAYAVNDYHDGPTLASEFHRLEKSLDLSPLLLLLALLALAAEGLLANPPPMRARPAANPQADLKEETSGIR